MDTPQKKTWAILQIFMIRIANVLIVLREHACLASINLHVTFPDPPPSTTSLPLLSLLLFFFLISQTCLLANNPDLALCNIFADH